MLKPPMTGEDALWKQRFRAPTILYTQLAEANFTRGLTASNRSGVNQLYAWDVPSGELRQLTHTPSGKLAGYIAPDGEYIYYMEDTRGNETGHYVRVPFSGGEAQDVTPDLPPYASFGRSVSRSGNLLSFLLGDDDGIHLYAVNLEGNNIGAPRRLYSAYNIGSAPLISQDGAIVVISGPLPDHPQHFQLLAFASASGEQLAQLSDGPASTLDPLLFSPSGDSRILAMSNQSGNNRPLIWDLHSGERTNLAVDELAGEVLPTDWSPDGQRILLLNINQAQHQLYIYHLADKTLTRLNHPGGTYSYFSAPYFGPAGDIYADWQDSTHPGCTIALDGESGALKRTVLSAGQAPGGHPWRSITYPTANGEQIQGWLALPDGPGPYPTILSTHGGPTSVASDLFSANSQMWLDHGYAFLTINYHGSTTFGRQFEESIRGHLGELELGDIVAARAWLIEQGLANPDQIIPQGGSYGGYLTLMALGCRPDLGWAAGLALVPVVDWVMNHEDSAPTLRAYDEMLFGGKPQDMPEQAARSSPLTYVQDVAAPVLIIAGRNDTRCPARPIEIYTARLKELGRAFALEWFDAGHGSYAVQKQVEQGESMLRFAYAALTGAEP